MGARDGGGTVSLPAGRRDGQLRFDPAEVAGGRVTVSVGSGRVELGHAAGQHLRIRWTLPAVLPERWRARLRLPAGPARRGPRVRSDAYGLHIRARRARLRIDVPDVMEVTVELGQGEITSWGAGCALELTTAGQISCRELTSRTVRATAQHVNLHFAAEPAHLVVDAPDSVVVLPPGRYAVTSPPDAEIEVTAAPDAASRVVVRGGRTRILASQPPLDLRGERPGERPAGG